VEELAAVGAAFAELMLTVLPWFALGTLTAAAMETFVPTAWAQRVLTGRAGLPAAVTTGAVLPGCSCTTMPLAAGLSGMAGSQVGTLTAFVFVSPLLSPITVLLTLSLLGWEMTAAPRRRCARRQPRDRPDHQPLPRALSNRSPAAAGPGR
jgi:uncharacterized membrane protein YraQ (UPF0718 family)